MKKLLLTLIIVFVASVAGMAQTKTTYVKNLDEKNYPRLVTPATRTYVIDFSAVWCGPCKMFAPTYNQVAEQLKSEVDFYKVDVDTSAPLAQRYRITSVPTIYIFNPRTSKSRTFQGVISKQQFLDGIASVE